MYIFVQDLEHKKNTMPNHIQNRIKFIGTEEQIKNVLDGIKSIDSDDYKNEIDFNNIIRMPEELSLEMNFKVETAVKKAVNFPLSDHSILKELQEASYRRSTTDTFTEEEKIQYAQGLENHRKYGAIYWYDWCINNWGTKWNAYGQNDKRNTSDTIYFQTAWNSPIDLMVELSKKFPEVTIELTYASEDSGSNTGIVKMCNGDVLSKYIPRSGTNEGYEIYFELHPDSRDDYELKDGEYKYKEDEEE